jgi:hypothetical protein
MRNIRNILAPAVVLAAAVVTPARAQHLAPVSFEARGGVALPVSDFNDGASTGWSIGGAVVYRLSSIVSVYGGYDRYSFSTDSAGLEEGLDASITDTGFRGGVRLNVPLAMGGVSPYLEGGVLAGNTAVHVGDGSGTVSVNSDFSAGFEVGGGVAVPLTTHLSLTPGARFRYRRAQFTDPNGDSSGTVTAQYVAIDLGVSFRP